MSSILVRKLEIYDICKIGDSDIIEMSCWLNDIFGNIKFTNEVNSNLCISNDNKLIVLDKKNKYLHIDYVQIWEMDEFKIQYSYDDIKEFITYIMHKYYKIKD